MTPPAPNDHLTPNAAAIDPLVTAPTTITPRVKTRDVTFTRPSRWFGVNRCCIERATGMRAPAGRPWMDQMTAAPHSDVALDIAIIAAPCANIIAERAARGPIARARRLPLSDPTKAATAPTAMSVPNPVGELSSSSVTMTTSRLMPAEAPK